jgi:hypothetical protein
MDIADTPLRLQARALLALGWVPSMDEPGRIYPLYADMPSAKTTVEIWLALLEIQAERAREERKP